MQGRAARGYRRSFLLLLLSLLSLVLPSMSGAASASIPNDDDTTGNKNPLLLEAGPSSSVDEIVHKLDMSSGSASIELGPLVVNEDGEAQASSIRQRLIQGRLANRRRTHLQAPSRASQTGSQ